MEWKIVWNFLLPKIQVDYSPKTNIDAAKKAKIDEVIEADVVRSNV